MHAAFIDVQGVPTRYMYAGSGNPVLLVHGIGAASDNWIRTLDPLGKRHAAYAPDNLGAGFTGIVGLGGGPPQPHMVRHLVAFVDALGLQRFDVVGHSYGGLLGALITLKHPARVRRLVLVSSASTFLPPADMRKALERSLSQLGPAVESSELEEFRKRKRRAAFDPASIPEELVYASFIANARPGRLEFYRAAVTGLIATAESTEHRVYARLEHIETPTLVISGRDDAGCPLEPMERGARRLPQHEHVVFDRCGHFPMLEHPVRFNELVTRFLA
jgi:pimeloyl-ACP methyl ester carboxylesterase